MPTKTKTATTVTKSATPKVIATGNYSGTIAARQALRESLFLTGDDREFFPLDYALIRPIVKDQYLAVFDHAVEHGIKCSVEIDLNKGYDPDQPITDNPGFKFIHAWIKANGKNRTPKENHYGMLATNFQKDFASDATHWVVDSNGMVGNGGHSGHGVALAFYPESVEYGVYGSRLLDDEKQPIFADTELGQENLTAWADYPGYLYTDSQGYVCQSSILPWKGSNDEQLRPGQYDEDGQYIAGTDSPDVRLSQDLTIVLRINADPKACLKMDDVRLEASFDDYLEMVGPIRAYLQKLPKKVQEMAGTLFRGFYLRVNHSSESFGSLGKGGRLTKNEVQQWFIAGLPHLLDSIELLKNELGNDLKQFPHFTPEKGMKGGVSLANALIAMMVSSQSGRERIAQVLTEQYQTFSKAPEYFRKMVSWIKKPGGSSDPAPSADQIVQCLVFLGEHKQDPVAEMLKAYPSGRKNAKEEDILLAPWQVRDNRVSGWDSSNEDDPANEEFTTVCIEAAQRIAEILGDEGAVKNAKMKATRRGAGSRGRNKSK